MLITYIIELYFFPDLILTESSIHTIALDEWIWWNLRKIVVSHTWVRMKIEKSLMLE